MSPLNRGPMLGPRMPPMGMRPPPPRFAGRLPPPGMPPRMLPPPMNLMFGPMRPQMPPSRMSGPVPMFAPRPRGMPSMMRPRGMGPRGPMMRPGPRGMPPPPGLPRLPPMFPPGRASMKIKRITGTKKLTKLEELELKKPWMTDEIGIEIQKKHKLYVKVKKSKDPKEWEEFKCQRNKLNRMIRDSKNDYLAVHPEQAHLYADEVPCDERDENYTSSEEELSYYCEVCDREFFSEECLAHHKMEHKVCGIDGCAFSAHPKLVEKHISMQHYTGLYHKIKDLSTPEDIQKWINERKKRYPTKANIEQREAEISEKKQRGEIIKEKQSLTQSKSKKEVFSRGKKRKNRRRPGQVQDPRTAVENKLYRGLLPFAGTMSLPESNSEDQTSLIEDLDENTLYVRGTDEISDEDETNVNTSCTTNNIPLLSSLVADYGSDSNEDEGPEEVPIKKMKTDAETQESIPLVAKSTITDSKSHSRLSADFQGKDPAMSENNKKSRVADMNKYEKKQNQKFKYKSNDERDKANYKNRNSKKLQLLNRLLSRSIQHERNLICQCIKYIVDNNYFA